MNLVQPVDRLDDVRGLLQLAARLDQRDRLPLAPVAPQFLAQALRVVRDDRAGRLQDRLRGAVILLQPDDLRARKAVGKLQQILNLRAAPGIDALVFVADHADVAVTFGEQPHQLELNGVGVLVLVDEDVAPALLVMPQHVEMRLKDVDDVQQQVVEVDRVVGQQPLLIAGVDLRTDRAEFAVEPRPRLVGRQHQDLRRADVVADLFRLDLRGADPHRPQAILDQRHLVGVVADREAVRQPDGLRLAPQDRHAERVKRGDREAGDIGAGQQPADAVAHLLGRLVGERRGEDLPRGHPLPLDQPRDAMRDDARLARTGAGDHQERAVGGRHGGLLLRVEVAEQFDEVGHGGRSSGDGRVGRGGTGVNGRFPILPAATPGRQSRPHPLQ
ncbi:MAG: hypothetical protein BWZ08_02360 [candidate division BRC1 bacterium ADurb.BinA292]|nr:MAG: hypothetical protein BWZ08_02360 [candidate division BRC1 bacterium ADurb.BinA292]